MYDTFRTMSDVMFFCQTLAVIEVVNAAFGVVKTGVVPTLIQVAGFPYLAATHLVTVAVRRLISQYLLLVIPLVMPAVVCLLQVVGRNFILFIIFGSLEEMHNKPVVFFVFYPWSAIEIFR